MNVEFCQENYKARYYGTKVDIEITPGLFLYSGFGMGNLFLGKRRKVWCSTSHAQNLCKQFDLEYRYVDSFDVYSGTYLGD